MLVRVGGTVKRSSSVLTLSHDCLCTKAIVVEYVGLTFLGRLSLAPSRRCSDSFPRGRAFYTFMRSHARGQKSTHQTPTSIRDASFGRLFYALSGHDVVGCAHAPFPNVTAPLLMSGMALRSTPPNRLPSP